MSLLIAPEVEVLQRDDRDFDGKKSDAMTTTEMETMSGA